MSPFGPIKWNFEMFNGCVLGVSSCAPAVLAPTSDKPSARHARCFFMAMVYDREVELFTARGRCGSNLSRVVQGDRVAYALRPLAPPGTFSLARLLRSRRHERRGCRLRWSEQRSLGARSWRRNGRKTLPDRLRGDDTRFHHFSPHRPGHLPQLLPRGLHSWAVFIHGACQMLNV